MIGNLATPAGMRRFALWWTLGCVVLGIATAAAILQLRETGAAIDRAGEALVTTGEAISGFEDLPLIGSDIGSTGGQISSQGERAAALADEARLRITLIAAFTGLLVALLGAAPMLVTWRVVVALQPGLVGHAPGA